MKTVSNQGNNLRIDPEKGIIKGISVMTMGTAKGHDLAIDMKTLQSVKAQAEQLGGKVLVKVNHGSGALDVCGQLVNFRIDGNRLLADWQLLKSHPAFAQLIETAQVQPETVGMSASFVGSDSNELSANGMKAARCKQLLSIDYVVHPAANVGLFSAKLNGEVINFSIFDGLKKKAAQGVLIGALLAPGLKRIAAQKAKGALKHPLTKAAGIGAAGALGAHTVSSIIERRKRKEEEERSHKLEIAVRYPNKPALARLSFSQGGHRISKTKLEMAHIQGAGGIAYPSRSLSVPVPMHLQAITESVIEFDSRRVPGPIRRKARPGPVLSGSSAQARDNQGRFQPGQQSTPEGMRKAYVAPMSNPDFIRKLRARQIAANRAKQNGAIH
ncbi:MAG: hypothetical protein ACQKBW_08165 [Puniceicoccales bacterium]